MCGDRLLAADPAVRTSDYRGLKKRITAIRIAQEQAADGSTPLLLHGTPAALDTHNVQTHSGHDDGQDPLTLSPRESLTDVERETDGHSVYDEPDVDQKLEVRLYVFVSRAHD